MSVVHLNFQTSLQRKTFHLIVVVQSFVSSSREDLTGLQG